MPVCYNLPETAPVVQHLQGLLATGTQWAAYGNDPLTGASCWGFVRYCYHLGGVLLPVLPEDAEAYFTPVARPYHAWDVLGCQFGLLRGSAPHMAVLLSGTEGWHCSKATNGVARFRLHDPLWQRVLRQGWRLKEWC